MANNSLEDKNVKMLLVVVVVGLVARTSHWKKKIVGRDLFERRKGIDVVVWDEFAQEERRTRSEHSTNVEQGGQGRGFCDWLKGGIGQWCGGGAEFLLRQ